MAGRILVIRGGAIGDFVLTLPAVRLIREAFPESHLEILGYRHILEIGAQRYYADATRSIEYGPLAGFFHPSADLDRELVQYFSSFHQVISYLFDPDGIFSGNLARAGVKNLIVGPGKLNDASHATAQLAAPLVRLGLFLENPGACVFPSSADRLAAASLLPIDMDSCIAMHPGSGSAKKNWPLSQWRMLIAEVQKRLPENPVVLVGGEADQAQLEELQSEFGNTVQVLNSVPLPELAAFFSRCRGFVGHDSGISHLAAASGIPCALMFGPTDPHVWAPQNPAVHILSAQSRQMDDIALESIMAVINDWPR